MPEPEPEPEPELEWTPLAILDALLPAKHTAKRVAASGNVESVQCVTKKLCFLYVRCSETGRLWECIAKLADGFLGLPDIAQLGEAAAGRTCSLLAYPERAVVGTVSLHVVSITFTAAVIPLALGHGAGAEVRQALGIAVFAGMLGVTLFGLFLTPVFYVALRKLAGPLSQDHGSTMEGEDHRPKNDPA